MCRAALKKFLLYGAMREKTPKLKDQKCQAEIYFISFEETKDLSGYVDNINPHLIPKSFSQGLQRDMVLRNLRWGHGPVCAR